VLRRVLTWSIVVVALAGLPLTALADQTTILVFSFENQTGDRNIDWIGPGLTDLIGDRLNSESELYVFNRAERGSAYDHLGIPETTSLSRASVMKMAWRIGADAAIIGAISGTHDDFRIRARVLDLSNNQFKSDVEVAGKLEDLIPLAAKLSSLLVKTLAPGSTAPEADYTSRPPIPPSAFEAYVRSLLTADPQRRMQLLQDAIRLHPQYASAMYQLGRIYHFDMNVNAAGPLLEKIAAGTPVYLQARFTLGLNYYYAGNYAKAAAVFSALPPIYEDLLNLGAALAAQGDANGALQAWKRAADREPLRPEAPFNIGLVAFTKDQLDLAAQSLEQFFKLQGRDSEALFLLGRVYEKQGRTESRRMIAQAIRSSPRVERWLSQPLTDNQRIATQVDPTEIRFALQTSIWNPSRLSRRALGIDLPMWLENVQNQVDSQLYGEAQRELQDILRTFPESPDARLLVAQVYQRQRQFDLALSEYRRSIELKPSADAYVLLARLYRTMNQPAPALDAVKAALALDPGNRVAAGLQTELERAATPGRP
jgi:tetratricopeptide (TPR) repeat protein